MVEPVTGRLRIGRRHDLDNIAILQLATERHNTAIDLRTCTGIADSRVNRKSKVYGCRTTRQLDHLSHRCKGVNILGIKVEFESLDKVLRVLVVLGFSNQRQQQLLDRLSKGV